MTRRLIPAGRTGLSLAPALALFFACLFLALPAAARCIPVADRDPGIRVWPAADTKDRESRRLAQSDGAKTGRGPALPAGALELTFLGHSSFLIRTHSNITAITDYNGYNRAAFAPDVVTMNRAHASHYTDSVEPGVKHVLKGWIEGGVIPRHDLRIGDLRVTNVPTNIRDSMAGGNGTAGNSIFIFESAGLCVVHLGHLHHLLRPGHAGRVGSVDILLAPIDNSWTMSHEALIRVIDQLRPKVVIPMHYGYGDNLRAFTAIMNGRKFALRDGKGSSAVFSKLTLPDRQTFLILKPGG
jgi:L-ascorbate metabolism protein UlaG (beta-lactamase superfamily)